MSDLKREVIVRPARRVNGGLQIPGDKSISHRYAMLAALAPGRTHIENFATGQDCASTLRCVEALGVQVERRDNATVDITGVGKTLKAPTVPLDCGNSGSTMRMLAGILAGQAFESELRGDDSLMRRPMRRVAEPLSAMGADIRTSETGTAPLVVRGGRLRAIEHKPPVPSAQVKSAVLFAGLFAEGTVAVEEGVRTRDHGELALRAFGVELSRTRTRVEMLGGQELQPIEAFVPGDLSSAAFMLSAAAILPESNLVLDHISMNPTRAAILDLLAGMGASLQVIKVEEQHGELIGTVQLRSRALRGGSISGAMTARLIDEIPVLAAIAPFTEQGLEISDARELRVKESDRLATVAENLRRMGAEVEERPDGLRIPGGQRLHGAEIEPNDDHRIAMAFAVAALRAEGETLIRDAGCASVSFPDFFERLESVLER